MKIRAIVTVKGVVQGVNFRYYTQQTALLCNVTGWVMNLPGGSVEGCFEGEEHAVQQLIDWCRRGPDRARVDKMTVELQAYSGEFNGFDIRR